jgi:hypothetical protein
MSAVNARMEKQKCRVLQTFSDISIFITLILNEYSGLFPVYPAERILRKEQYVEMSFLATGKFVSYIKNNKISVS